MKQNEVYLMICCALESQYRHKIRSIEINKSRKSVTAKMKDGSEYLITAREQPTSALSRTPEYEGRYK